MTWIPGSKKTRWVVHADELTVATVKALAAAKHQSIGYTLDQAVEYFSRHVLIEPDKPLHWNLPDDF